MTVTLNRPQAAASISPFLGLQWRAQRKLDGVRFAVVYGNDGRPAYGITKNGKRLAPPRGLPDMPPGATVDGEIAGGWQSALSQTTRGQVERWQAFDLVSDEPLHQRFDFLVRAGFSPPSQLLVQKAWDLSIEEGWEGIVIRQLTSGYASPAFKVKPDRVFNAIAMKGFLMVLDGSRVHTVARCPAELAGPVVVSCEGVTTRRKVRSARVLRPASPEANVNISQLERLVFL